jgi:ribulose-5-phosphate 4-epimerase/fuculose-1-phosphate aldolase
MANHGVVVTGKSVAAAYHRLYFLERACRTQLFSMWTGAKRKFIADAALDKVRLQFKQGDPQLAMTPADYFYTAMKRLLDKQGSIYAD